MSERTKLLDDIATRIETNQRGWLPIAGHVVNVTFDLDEADLVSKVLRRDHLFEEMVRALKDVRSRAQWELDAPTEMRDTAFSLIVKSTDAILAKVREAKS
jgi:hypothetical protein